MIYSLYDADGRIVIHYHGDRPNDQGLYNYVEGEYRMDDYYIDNGTPTLRPQLDLTISKTVLAADGVDSITITGSITGEMLLIRGPVPQLIELDADEYEFTTTIPGIYTLRIEAFPKKPKEFAIVATVPE